MQKNAPHSWNFFVLFLKEGGTPATLFIVLQPYPFILFLDGYVFSPSLMEETRVSFFLCTQLLNKLWYFILFSSIRSLHIVVVFLSWRKSYSPIITQCTETLSPHTPPCLCFLAHCKNYYFAARIGRIIKVNGGNLKGPFTPQGEWSSRETSRDTENRTMLGRHARRNTFMNIMLKAACKNKTRTAKRSRENLFH